MIKYLFAALSAENTKSGKEASDSFPVKNFYGLTVG
jgi:hypothetical protein